VASTLLAQRSLDAHVLAVANALEQEGVEAGRRAVSMIVGRDTAALDEAGVSRAAIESLAENFSDGVVAPLFWLLVAGLPGIFGYKAINTADSMIGHKTDRYLAFGWASARVDDLVNLPASRLAALWLVLAAAALSGLSPRGAIAAMRRDANGHRSPNAGWPEAAVAGALGLRLAGPRAYDGAMVDDHWIGDGRETASARDIRLALRQYRVACVIQFVCVVALAAAIALL
jgi:adenosylcobinamide-phosphate synthase